MLGFSIQKLLVLAAVIGAVWFGFKFIGRMQQVRDAEAKDAKARNAKARGVGSEGAAKRGSFGERFRGWVGGRGGGEAGDGAEDLVQCPRCGAYVAARGASSCGRSDCPY